MDNNINDPLKPPAQKIPYDFGVIEKITLTAAENELSIFASADAFPGDGCDPTGPCNTV